jgi:hypothetical protein
MTGVRHKSRTNDIVASLSSSSLFSVQLFGLHQFFLYNVSLYSVLQSNEFAQCNACLLLIAVIIF